MVSHGKVQQRQQLQPKIQTPPQSLFPCASGVTMPQFGAEESEPGKGVRKAMAGRLTLRPAPVDTSPVDRRYLKKISTEMTFEEDVVRERCFFMLPYDTKYLAEALDYTDIITPRPRVRQPVGRHDAHGTDLRHMPCGLRTTKPPSSLKPLKKKIAIKALAMSTAAREGEETSSCESPSCATSQTGTEKEKAAAEQKPTGDTFMTEVHTTGPTAATAPPALKGASTAKPGSPETLQELQGKLKALRDAAAQEEEEQKRPKSARMRAEKNQKDWDAYLMSQLSQLTATWIVHERMDANRQKEELQKTLEEWYGRPRHTDLIHEEGSDSDTDFPLLGKDKKVKPKKKWKKDEESLLERVYQLKHAKSEANDPYSDDNKAPFYRQPAGIRKQKKHHEKEEAENEEFCKSSGAINATAHRIKVKSSKLPKPPTLRDFMPKGVGNTLYETENQYEQELLAGVEQMHPAKGDGSILVMASDHKYQKVLRRDYPDAPETWFPATDKEKQQQKQDAQQQPIKREHGAKRWRALPQPYDDTFLAQKMVPPGFTPQFRQEDDPSRKKKVKQSPILSSILHDWRSRWNLSGQFADASFDDIIRDMADIQPHVRLKAIATVGKAAEYKPPSDPGIQIGSQNDLSDPLSEVPEKVFVALDCLLGDTNDQVRRAAAITLFALDHPTEKAEGILRKALLSEAPSERWAAAQCLAHFGVCDSHVVDEIIKQILGSEDAIKHEQGITLLAKISNSTTLVHCMVAEQLNSSSWRHRVIACKILPTLYGSINKDVCHKLTELMWHDWHTEVRHSAAQCLGKTCHGRNVHDDIRRCIMYGSERTKLEAISRLGQLGIMTAKLLPAFLQCFEDQYVSIRSECCITAGNLQIKEERVTDKLVHLATYDPIWKVKALAIQALGKIGLVSEAIKDALLWAMRYEEKEGVRAEACHSLVILDVMDDEVIQVLQERLLVESSQVVRDEMVEALQQVGLSATEDMDMVAQIKGEVRKLCKRNVIASQIVLNEADEMRQENLQTMIFMTQEELKRRRKNVNRRKYLKVLRGKEYNNYLLMKGKNRQAKVLEKEEERQESAMKRLREIASATASASGSGHQSDTVPSGSQHQQQESSSPDSCTTTPDPYSREGTMFTPSADKELQAILSRAEGTTVGASVSRESSLKSQTGASEGPDTSGTYSSPVSSRTSKHSLPDEYVEEADRQVAASTATPTREASQIPSAIMTSRSRQGVSPTASVMLGDRSQVSGGRRTVMSRETLREREKVDNHTNATYVELIARYSSMNQQLAVMDQGLSVAAPGTTSNFLTVPGEPSAPPASNDPSNNTNNNNTEFTSTTSATTTSTEPGQSQETGADNIVASEGTSVIFSLGEEDASDTRSGTVVGEGEGERKYDDDNDGQIAVSLEVPVSEQPEVDDSSDRNDDNQRRLSPLSLEFTSMDEDAGGGTTSYLDDSGGENAVPGAHSNYAGSEAYPPGQASEYGTSEGYDDDDQSTLDE